MTVGIPNELEFSGYYALESIPYFKLGATIRRRKKHDTGAWTRHSFFNCNKASNLDLRSKLGSKLAVTKASSQRLQ